MSNLLPYTALALTLGLGLQAAPPAEEHTERPRMEEMQARIAARLHLTEAQKASIQETRTKHHESLSAKRKAAMAAHEAFTQAMRKPESKPEDLKTLHQTATALSFDLQLEHRALRQELRALLTPEQREQSARMEGRFEGRRERMGRRHGLEMGHPGESRGISADR